MQYLLTISVHQWHLSPCAWILDPTYSPFHLFLGYACQPSWGYMTKYINARKMQRMSFKSYGTISWTHNTHTTNQNQNRKTQTKYMLWNQDRSLVLIYVFSYEHSGIFPGNNIHINVRMSFMHKFSLIVFIQQNVNSSFFRLFCQYISNYKCMVHKNTT